MVKIGVWEEGKFIGTVLFSRGANNNIGSPYSLRCTEVCELTRVALNAHATPVSRIVAIAIKMLHRYVTGIRLIISYADSNEGHVGIIYQAGGWIYGGESQSTPKYRDSQGRIWKQRQVSKSGVIHEFGKAKHATKIDDCVAISQLNKHRYLMPLDDEIRRRILPLAKPYPKKSRAVSIESDALSDPTERGSSNAITALQAAALLQRVEEAEHA